MEVFFLKIVSLAIKCVFAIPLVIYSFLSEKERQVYEWLEEYNFIYILDAANGMFFAFVASNKLLGLDIALHGVIEQISFYFGFVSLIVWGVFRCRIYYLDMDLKQLDKQIKYQLLKEKEMTNKIMEDSLKK